LFSPNQPFYREPPLAAWWDSTAAAGDYSSAVAPPSPWHGRSYFALFFRRQLEDVIGQQLAMISLITLKRRGVGPAKTSDYSAA